MMERMQAAGVVPVVVLDKADDAVPLAETLFEEGIDIIEITCRTPVAFDAIETVSRSLPEMVAGAGTVLSVEDAARAREAGAQFVVAPGCNPPVVEAAKELDLTVVPGVMTPSDIERAYALGCTVQKFFPAGAAGGPSMLKALAGPYSHLGLGFVPTGGVSAENLRSYLELPIVVAVGGSWIVKRDLIAEHDWEEIRRRVREAREIVASSRPAR